MRIGSVFDQTSTAEFIAMLDQRFDNERLLFSYVELSPDGGQPRPDGERIIARIINVHKENPLLSRDQAGMSASIDVSGLGFDFSRRFTYGWAQCAVIGRLTATAGGLDMNQRVVSPNVEVHTPSPETLRQMFFCNAPLNSTLAIRKSPLCSPGKSGQAPFGNSVKSDWEIDITKCPSPPRPCHEALIGLPFSCHPVAGKMAKVECKELPLKDHRYEPLDALNALWDKT